MVLETPWVIINSVDFQKQMVLIKKKKKQTTKTKQKPQHQQKKTKSNSWLLLKNGVTPISLEVVLPRWSSTLWLAFSLEEDNLAAKSRRGHSR